MERSKSPISSKESEAKSSFCILDQLEEQHVAFLVFFSFLLLGLVYSVVDPDEFNPDGFNPDTTLQIIWISASDTDLDPIVPQIHPDRIPIRTTPCLNAECESFHTARPSIH
jgi:hypothetical protein